MKKRLLIGGAAVLAIVFLPIFPIPRSKANWSQTEFEAKRAEIERAADKINTWTHELGRDLGFENMETYSLHCRYESGKTFRSIAGIETGLRVTTGWAFGVSIIPTVPFLEYSTDSEAYLHPEKFADFIRWVDERNQYETIPFDLYQQRTGRASADRPEKRSESIDSPDSNP